MKRLFLVIAFCFGMTAGFAQDAVDAIQLKNDGNEALRGKNYKKALELFEKSIANWPEDEEEDKAMIYNAGFCAYKIKDYTKAVKFFDQSIDSNYKVSTAYLYKADSQRKSGDKDGYVETLEAGIAANPNDSKMKSMLSTHFLKAGNAFYKKGANILKQAAADVSAGKYTTADEQYQQATTEAKDEFKKALPYFERALKIEPNDATAKQLKEACTEAIKG